MLMYDRKGQLSADVRNARRVEVIVEPKPKFPFFLHLPPEIRFMIWKLTHPIGRVIALGGLGREQVRRRGRYVYEAHEGAMRLFFNINDYTLICKEARYVFFLYYRFFSLNDTGFGKFDPKTLGQKSKNSILINPAKDTLLSRLHHLDSEEVDVPLYFSKINFTGIQNLAFGIHRSRHQLARMTDIFYKSAHFFPNLKNFTFVFPNFRQNRARNRCVRQLFILDDDLLDVYFDCEQKNTYIEVFFRKPSWTSTLIKLMSIGRDIRETFSSRAPAHSAIRPKFEVALSAFLYGPTIGHRSRNIFQPLVRRTPREAEVAYFGIFEEKSGPQTKLSHHLKLCDFYHAIVRTDANGRTLSTTNGIEDIRYLFDAESG